MIKDADRLIDANRKNNKGYKLRGWANFEMGNSKQALKDFTKAVKLASDEPAARIDRAQVYRKTGEFKRAFKDLEEAEEMDSEHPWLWWERGALYSSSGLPEKALECIEKGFENYENPKWQSATYEWQSAEGHAYRAEALLLLDQKDEAQEALKKAQELNIELPEVKRVARLLENHRDQ